MQMSSSLDLYNDFFGLSERPFSLVPDPDFLYWSDSHRRAYAMLEYGLLTHSPITLITGEVGAGKTTLVHHLLKNLPLDLTVGLVSNAQGGHGELLRWVLMAFGHEAASPRTYVDLFNQFQTFLIDEYASGRRVILIFDEAQNLSREALEELRMFTNINSNKDELLQIILVGQPELRGMIRRPDLKQFAQRVAASFHLKALDAETVQAYITHRMRQAGSLQDVFSDRACRLVHQATAGVPRLVNQLCDLALVYAFSYEQRLITEKEVQRVLDDGVFFGRIDETGLDEG
jgi:general secretion pathway protein A